ncbi:formin-like protein 16 [Pollicipes pollicipes]|uniref:formin-like protein 16 n=1 Tax=Pollicipes pollicipes TaxID=41117 RepID=UPI00188547BB|nr:formin-like protein 16 [Pollicipes pollicipes]XP_037094322.1 formin-like protein 16 [Pollicipes pollicipes]XP_037094383.1 formin-like protein 16 [Pollicipes pollicipes]
MTRNEVRPPAVRRANSFEALPRASGGPQRSFSFRGPPAGGRRIANTEPKVAFDLRTTVIGESPRSPRALVPSPNSAFSPPEPSIAETALNHLPPPPPSLLPPPPSPMRLYEEADRLSDMPRMRSPRSLGVINQLSSTGNKRDSANFSMSVSSGSDAGST